jgi:hypothetical protein
VVKFYGSYSVFYVVLYVSLIYCVHLEAKVRS